MAETSTHQAAGTQAITVGMARRPGTEPPCADGYDLQRRGQRVCAAVVDGAGHDAAVVRYAQAVPPVITHIGMTMGGLAALTTAGQMAHAYDTPPHASAVYARMEPGQPTTIHWIGDCRAYAWDGTALTQWSTDQTMGQYLRRNGVAVDLAAAHDNWSRTGLAQAGAAMCRETQIPEHVRLVLLVTDGVSDQVDVEEMERLCRAHETDPQALADALTAAAQADADGYRDDATVIALLRPPRLTGGREGSGESVDRPGRGRRSLDPEPATHPATPVPEDARPPAWWNALPDGLRPETHSPGRRPRSRSPALVEKRQHRPASPRRPSKTNWTAAAHCCRYARARYSDHYAG